MGESPGGRFREGAVAGMTPPEVVVGKGGKRKDARCAGGKEDGDEDLF
jgi:hypothetical protein